MGIKLRNRKYGRNLECTLRMWRTFGKKASDFK